jgi:beta-lactamase regulating signal transducer with metallopeptidase domain
VLSILFTTFIKGSVVFIIVYLTVSTLKNLSPEFKHLIWFVVLCGIVLIPIFSFFRSVFYVSVPRITDGRGEVYRTFTSQLFALSTYPEAARLSSQSTAAYSPMSAQSPHLNLHWSFWALVIWVAGIFLFSLRIVIGRIGLFHLRERAQRLQFKRCDHMMKLLSVKMGINKRVDLLKSAQCKVPFAAKVYKPVVVVPSDMDRVLTTSS